VLRRSQHDREILKLALPALGALAAEPLYILVDTAIVGHLGTPQLAALALAGAMLTGTFTIFNFLTYGTTAQVARYHGAGREEVAGSMAAQALWLATAIGVLLLVLGLALAVPAVHLLGGSHHTGSLAVLYLRIGALGLPFALIALAGFDDAGYRLGYGGGFFDRTLAVISPPPLTIGVGFELARVPTIHPQPHDIPLDYIVTERGIQRRESDRLVVTMPGCRTRFAIERRPPLRRPGDQRPASSCALKSTMNSFASPSRAVRSASTGSA